MSYSYDDVYVLHAWRDNRRRLVLTQGEGYSGTITDNDVIKAPRFQLKDERGVIAIPTSGNPIVQLAVTRSNRTEDLLTCVVEDSENGIIYCPITKSLSDIAGDIKGEIRLITANAVTKFYGVDFYVFNGVSDSAAAQSTQFSDLIHALQKVINITGGGTVADMDDVIEHGGLNPVASGVIYDYLNGNFYTKTQTDNLLADKIDYISLPFVPVHVYKDKCCDGWINWVDTTSPFYGDPHFSTSTGYTGLIFPVKGHKGMMTWKVNKTYNNQIIVLDENLKRVANKNFTISNEAENEVTVSFDFGHNFKNIDFSYIAFSTTDVSSITFKEILSSEGFYIEDHEIFNDKLVVADFFPPYCYSLETDLYFYPQALFNKPLNVVYNNGSNSIVQAIVENNVWHNLSLPNIASPTGTAVELVGGKKVLFIGDSFTAHGIYIKYVYDTMNSLGKAPILLGTQSTTINGVQYQHEGHSGWRAFTYACCAVESGANGDSALTGNKINPFWNENLVNPPILREDTDKARPIKFDFEYYVNNYLNTQVPDIVFINLGTNDFSPTRKDYNTEDDVSTVLKVMVKSIKDYNVNNSTNIAIIGWLPVQLPIGVNSGYNRWEGISKYSQILISDNNKSVNDQTKIGFTALCPVRYAFDCYNDGRYVTQNINGHDMILLSDTTHPSELGYQHIGQMIIPYIHNY